MEIRELNLAAFGPFSDRLLDFTSSGGGLHIVYGPNEAGKSSSLRGLKSLLFGIPARTTDNFLHNNTALRIAGKLRNNNGQELIVVRRKGNKNTLSLPAGEPLDDAALAPFLHGVNVEVFEMLFGIDHEALVQGGREILEQKGEVGQALFAASMGSAALHGVLEQLEREADELFKPRGSVQVINASLKEYSQLQKDIKARSLSSREWGDARRALERTNKALAQLQDELAQGKARRNRLRRIQRALPKITAWREFQQRLEALGSVVLLPVDFGERRQAAAVELEKAQATANSAASNLDGLQQQIAAITVNGTVLEFAETIEDLHARLGGHRKAMQDRPRLEAERNQLLADAESLLKDVRPELTLAEVETLRPVLKKRVRITELGNQRQALTERVTQAGKALRHSETRLQQLRVDCEGVAEAGSPEALRQQVTLARKLGDLDKVLRAGRSELESLEKGCLDDLSRLAVLWRGALEDVSGLPLPARASIDQFEQAYAELAARVQRLGDKQDAYASAASEAQKQLDEIQHAGAIPVEQDLLDVRTGRDRAWGLLRRQWLEGETVDNEARELDPDRALPEAFESRIVDADELADRLRREADRVHKQASLLVAQADARLRIEQVSGELAVCNEAQQQLDGEWDSLWTPCNIQPRTPREMRAWLEEMEKLRERIGKLNGLRQQTSDNTQVRNVHLQALQLELKALGKAIPGTESLETLLAESETLVDRIEAFARQKTALEKEIKTLEQSLETALFEQQDASNELATWKGEWQGAVQDLGLAVDALPAEVADILENTRRLFDKQKDAEKLRLRIAGIDTDAGAFREEVAAVVASVTPELAEQPAEQAVVHLNRSLSEAGKQEANRQQYVEQIQNAGQAIERAEATRKTMTERLDTLCKEAQCADYPGLEPAERRSGEYKSLKSDIEMLEQELRDIGEGMTLAELEAESDEANPDTLPGEIDALTSQIDDELEPQKTELAVAKGEQQQELGLMDGSDDAAALADEAESVLVGIRSNAEQYVRVKLASRILRNEIERYRQQHQGPLLERASEHFAVLTQGSFAGLNADFNEKDEPVLVGVRPDDGRVYVEGMSSGTRDQLYLALRLASLEKYMESAEPMPFIVDDILVHFDDERSKATLGVLAELAGKTQIILFTHHRRLVEQAQALGAAAPVTVHEL